ncbi:hypothetical protein, partial [Rhizobium leucaenae]|uniref:hypothetical protein n=1 Tax=Rhizobium leucaenae TaxID=29450 RepID=UPI001AEF104B
KSLSTASTPPAKAKSVTHVSGTKRHLSLGSGTQENQGYNQIHCKVALLFEFHVAPAKRDLALEAANPKERN